MRESNKKIWVANQWIRIIRISIYVSSALTCFLLFAAIVTEVGTGYKSGTAYFVFLIAYGLLSFVAFSIVLSKLKYGSEEIVIKNKK